MKLLFIFHGAFSDFLDSGQYATATLGSKTFQCCHVPSVSLLIRRDTHGHLGHLTALADVSGENSEPDGHSIKKMVALFKLSAWPRLVELKVCRGDVHFLRFFKFPHAHYFHLSSLSVFSLTLSRSLSVFALCYVSLVLSVRCLLRREHMWTPNQIQMTTTHTAGLIVST